MTSSKILEKWRRSGVAATPAPVTPEQAAVMPDPIPPKGGTGAVAAKKKKKEPNRFRLPHNAHFSSVYNAEIQQWKTVLVVDDWRAEAQASGVHHSMKKLGKLYIKDHKPAEQSAA